MAEKRINIFSATSVSEKGYFHLLLPQCSYQYALRIALFTFLPVSFWSLLVCLPKSKV